jgi:hypothetical protein
LTPRVWKEEIESTSSLVVTYAALVMAFSPLAQLDCLRIQFATSRRAVFFKSTDAAI